MPNFGTTIAFPRRDNVYKKFNSLPYDEVESIIWKQREHDERSGDEFRMWIAHAITGLVIGVTAFVMDRLEEALVNTNRVWA